MRGRSIAVQRPARVRRKRTIYNELRVVCARVSAAVATAAAMICYLLLQHRDEQQENDR